MKTSKPTSDRAKKHFLVYIAIGVLILGVLGNVLGYYYLKGNLPFISKIPGQGDAVIPGPDVAFQEPQPDLRIAVGESFDVFVIARDVLGVVRLDLWLDDTLMLSLNSPVEEGITPLVLNYGMQGVEPGSYTLVARAYNSMGALGESMAVQVTVSESSANLMEIGPSLYIAQDGDTVESVAKDFGVSAPKISNANPGLNNDLSQGQPVAIPGIPPLPKALPPANVPGMGVLPNPISPQSAMGNLLPNGDEIHKLAVDFAAGKSVQVVPSLLPNFKPLVNINNPKISAPDSLTATSKDCKVSLAWVDKSPNETGFAIYRRNDPGGPASELLAIVPAGRTSYVDEVPTPGKYEYTVEARGVVQSLAPGQIVDPLKKTVSASRSAPSSVEVKPSAACIEDPTFAKYLYFQPIEVSSTYPDVWKMGLWYSINDSSARRIPGQGGNYFNPGLWSVSEEVLPLPASLYLNPNQSVVINMWAVGETRSSFFDSSPRPELGQVYTSHKLSDLGSNMNIYKAEGEFFKVRYATWLESVLWTGKGTTTTIQAPTNLRVESMTDTARVIAWDWNGDPQMIDGYILYRSYSCPGRTTDIRAPKMLPVSQKTMFIPFSSEVLGCAYRYQVSAYGRMGESAASNAISGSTETKNAMANVTFEKLVINSIPGGDAAQAKIAFYVNQYRIESQNLALKPSVMNLYNGSGKYDDYDVRYASFGINEALTIGFSVSSFDEDGFLQPGRICQGEITLPPIATWKKDKSGDLAFVDKTIRSSQGDCEVSLKIKGWTVDAASEFFRGYGGTVSRAKPIADIEITEISRIGYSLYALIQNNGPDTLTYQPLKLNVQWGVNGNFDNHDSQIIWVQENLPMWVHLSYALDDDYHALCSPNPKKCSADQFKVYADIGSYGDAPPWGEIDYSYQERKENNNNKYYSLDKVDIMK